MKSMAVMELMTLLLLKRQGIPLKRDIVFLACADEEQGGVCGIDWLDAHHPELFDVEYVINEGGYGTTEMFGVQRPVFTCSVGEKGPLWLRLDRSRPARPRLGAARATTAWRGSSAPSTRSRRGRGPITLLPEVRDDARAAEERRHLRRGNLREGACVLSPRATRSCARS